MMFNVDKCSLLHGEYNNARADLELGGKPLVSHESERDLGGMVQSDLKVDQRCCKVANEAKRNLGMIRLSCTRQWLGHTWTTLVTLYKI